MIWGSCAGYLTERANRWLIPGLERNRLDGDVVVISHSDRIAVAYNEILEMADGPVVLLHDDVELLDGARQAIVEAWETADVVGVIGGSGFDQLAWWAAKIQRGRVSHDGESYIQRREHGPVDGVDGLLLALNTEAARTLRFDTDYGGFHGYDIDICFQARQAGFRVATSEIPLVHHTKGGFGDAHAWNLADLRWRSKWCG